MIYNWEENRRPALDRDVENDRHSHRPRGSRVMDGSACRMHPIGPFPSNHLRKSKLALATHQPPLESEGFSRLSSCPQRHVAPGACVLLLSHGIRLLANGAYDDQNQGSVPKFLERPAASCKLRCQGHLTRQGSCETIFISQQNIPRAQDEAIADDWNRDGVQPPDFQGCWGHQAQHLSHPREAPFRRKSTDIGFSLG